MATSADTGVIPAAPATTSTAPAPAPLAAEAPAVANDAAPPAAAEVPAVPTAAPPTKETPAVSAGTKTAQAPPDTVEKPPAVPPPTTAEIALSDRRDAAAESLKARALLSAKGTERVVVHAFEARHEDEMSIKIGEEAVVVDPTPSAGNAWMRIRIGEREGICPVAYTSELGQDASTRLQEFNSLLMSDFIGEGRDLVFPPDVLVEDVDGKPFPRAASVGRLINHLVTDGASSLPFVDIFLTTFITFLSTCDLMSALRERFTSGPDAVRVRTAMVVHRWVDLQPLHFLDSKPLTDALFEFCEKMLPEANLARLGAHIKATAALRAEFGRQRWEAHMPPPPQFKAKRLAKAAKQGGDAIFAETDASELARQLTMLQWEAFNHLGDHELLDGAWTKDDEETPAVKRLVALSNATTMWAAKLAMSGKTPKARAANLSKLLMIANEGRNIGNYDLVVAIANAMELNPVFRLKKTWAAVSNKMLDLYDELKAFVSADGNYARLRSATSSRPPPCLPYLGLVLRDLTFLHDAFKKELPAEIALDVSVTPTTTTTVAVTASHQMFGREIVSKAVASFPANNVEKLCLVLPPVEGKIQQWVHPEARLNQYLMKKGPAELLPRFQPFPVVLGAGSEAQELELDYTEDVAAHIVRVAKAAGVAEDGGAREARELGSSPLPPPRDDVEGLGGLRLRACDLRLMVQGSSTPLKQDKPLWRQDVPPGTPLCVRLEPLALRTLELQGLARPVVAFILRECQAMLGSGEVAAPPALAAQLVAVHNKLNEIAGTGDLAMTPELRALPTKKFSAMIKDGVTTLGGVDNVDEEELSMMYITLMSELPCFGVQLFPCTKTSSNKKKLLGVSAGLSYPGMPMNLDQPIIVVLEEGEINVALPLADITLNQDVAECKLTVVADRERVYAFENPADLATVFDTAMTLLEPAEEDRVPMVHGMPKYPKDTADPKEPEPADRLVHFARHRRVAAVLASIHERQAVPYRFEVVPEIREYLEARPLVEAAELKELSLQAEPKK